MIDSEDWETVLARTGQMATFTVRASGPDRVKLATTKMSALLAMLPETTGQQIVLFAITHRPSILDGISMDDLSYITDMIEAALGGEMDVIFGRGADEALIEELQLVVAVSV